MADAARPLPMELRLARRLAPAVAAAGRRLVVYGEDMMGARRRGLVLALPLLSIVVGLVLAGRRVVLNTWSVDYALPLDTGWRWLHGQVPHIDFDTPVGALYWLVEGLALQAFHLDPRAPVFANLAVAAVLAVVGWALDAPRLSGGLAGLAMLGTLLLVASPRGPGDLPGQVSYLAAYNRIGLAVTAILLVALFVEPRRAQGAARRAAEALAVAALMLARFYLKLSFVAVVAAGALVAPHYAPANARTVYPALAALVAGVLVVGALTGINGPYLANVAAVADASPLFRPAWLAAGIGYDIAGVLLTLAALVLYARWSDAGAPARTRALVLAIGLLAAGALAVNQVHDKALPLMFVALAVLAEHAWRQHLAATAGGGEPMPPGRPRAFVAPAVAALLLVGMTTLKDMASAAVYFRYQDDPTGIAGCADAAVPVCRIDYLVFRPVVAKDMAPHPTPRVNATRPDRATLAALPVDGLAAIQRGCDFDRMCIYWRSFDQLYTLLNHLLVATDRPFYLSFMNPIPFAWQLAPPRDVPAWVDSGRTVSAASLPDPERLLSDVTVLVLSRFDHTFGVEPDLIEAYRPVIDARFDEVRTTELWTIWVRKDAW